MTTLICLECGGLVSPRAYQCPHCGAPLKKKPGWIAPVLTVLIIIVAIVLLSQAFNR